MNVENWVYNKLGRPQIDVVGEVLANLNNSEVDWINVKSTHRDGTPIIAKIVPTARIRGGCDLEAVAHYFRLSAREVVGEFNFVRGGAAIRLDHSLSLVNALSGLDPTVVAAALPLGYVPEDFVSNYFAPSSAGGIWIYNPVADSTIVVYRHKKLGLRIPFEFYGLSLPPEDYRLLDDEAVEAVVKARELDNEKAVFIKSALHYLRNDFEYEGPLNEEAELELLNHIFSRVPSSGVMIVLLRNETVQRNGILHERAKVKKMNSLIQRAATTYNNIRLLRIRDFIYEESEVTGGDHFGRMVYHRIYQGVLSAAGY